MRLNNFNLDFISGHIPHYQQKNIPVKTNQFYRDAFIYQMKEGQGLPNNVKRQMGLNNIFEDERNFPPNIGQNKKRTNSKHNIASIELKPLEPPVTARATQKKRNKTAIQNENKRNNNFETPQQNQLVIMYPKKSFYSQQHDQKQKQERQNEIDDSNYIKQFIKSEQQRIYFVKPLGEMKETKPNKKEKKSQNLQNQIVQSKQIEEVIEDTSNIKSIQQNHENIQQLQQIQSENNLNESSNHFKDKFQNQNINKILSGGLDQNHNIESKEQQRNQKFDRISSTSHQTKRNQNSTDGNFLRLSSDKKFLNTGQEIQQELQQDNENKKKQQQEYFIDGQGLSTDQLNTKTINHNTNSQETSNNTMIFKLVKERQNNQQESYMKDIEANNQVNDNQQQNQYFQNPFQQEIKGQEIYLNDSNTRPYTQQVGRNRNNIILGNLNMITPSMYKEVAKVNQAILSSPVVITKYQINQHFSNSQTISNQIREQVNSEQRKELLSFFNENRYKFFSNSDLNAEKFFVTRNRERIKYLNFERIGIFKSKQPKTHVKNFRFFINDIKVSEPRFQNPLKTEQEQLSLEQSFRKASHASHNSKLSNSELTKESFPSNSQTQNIIMGLTGDGEYNQRPLLNSPISSDALKPNNSQNNTKNSNQANHFKFGAQDIKQVTAGQSSFSPHSITQENSARNIKNSDINNQQNLESNENSNLNKLKFSYTNFVQQNMHPKFQQDQFRNHQIQEEKDESIIEEDQNPQNTQNREKKVQLENKNHQGSLSNITQVQSNTNIKSKKILRIISGTQINEYDQSNNRKQSKNDISSSQNIVITEYDEQNKKTQNEFSQDSHTQSSKKDGQNINNKEKILKTSLKQKSQTKIPSQGIEKITQKLVGQNSYEFDQNYLIYMQSEKNKDEEYIYSNQFREQIKILEEEQKRLESIENLFFLKLNDKQLEFYQSEDFKIHRKKLLLDTILKNKKITTRDKKLIFQNLLYQYNVKSKYHSEKWCKQMTDFLMTNKFKYNLDDAANRSYQRAHQKIIQLPTFRDQNGEYYHDIYHFVNQLAYPSPLTTEENEVHFQEILPESNLNKQQDILNIKRFQPKKLSSSYSHFQYTKFKY